MSHSIFWLAIEQLKGNVSVVILFFPNLFLWECDFPIFKIPMEIVDTMDVSTAKFLIIFAFTYVQLVHCLKSMSVISRFPEQKIFYSRLVSYSHEKP